MNKVCFEINQTEYHLVYDNKSIVTVNGVIKGNAIACLRSLITLLELDIPLRNKSGKTKNTNQLMKEVIIAIQQSKNEKIVLKEKNLNYEVLNPVYNFNEIEVGEMNIQGLFKWKRVQFDGENYIFNNLFKYKKNESMIYRWCASNEIETLFYFGETKEFKKRINHYLNPGKKQMTNIRINNEFNELAKRGYLIHLDILDIDEFLVGESKISDFNMKEFRRLVENYFIITAKASSVIVLNK